MSAGPLAQIFVLDRGQRVGVTLGDAVKRVFGVDLLSGDPRRPRRSASVFQHQQVRVENAPFRRPHASLTLCCTSSICWRVWTSARSSRLTSSVSSRVRQSALGNRVLAFANDVNLATADAGGDRNPPEYLFAYMRPLAHALRLADSQGERKEFLTAGGFL